MNKYPIIILIVIIFATDIYGSTQTTSIHSPELAEEFANFLLDNEEFNLASIEYKRLLLKLKATDGDVRTDSLELKLGFCYNKLGDLPRSRELFQYLSKNTDNSEIREFCYFSMAYCDFKLGLYNESLSLLTALSPGYSSKNETYFHWLTLNAGNRLALGEWNIAEKIISDLETNYGQYEITASFRKAQIDKLNWSDKSPLLAGSLSAIIPGLGKIYSGKMVDGLTSMVLIGFTAYNAHRGFSKNGSGSIRGYFYTSLGAVFYLGNIYGSYIAVKVDKEIRKDKFENTLKIELVKAFGF